MQLNYPIRLFGRTDRLLRIQEALAKLNDCWNQDKSVLRIMDMRIRSYGIAVVAVVSTILLTRVFAPRVSPIGGLFLAFSIAIAVSARYGGLKPGLLATSLSTLCTIAVLAHQSALNLASQLQLSLFVVQGVLISALGRSSRRQQSNSLVPAQRIDEGQWQAVLEASHVGTWEWNSLTDQVIWSNGQQMLGPDANSFKGCPQDLLRLVHPDDRELVKQTISDAIAQKQPFRQELRLFPLNGATRWIVLEGQCINNRSGRLVRVIGTTINITEYKQSEIALQQQNERERLVILITQRLRRSLNLAEILNTTVTEVRQFFQADRVVVYQFHPGWNGTVVVESTADPWTPISGSTVRDPYFGESYAQFYQQGGITSIADIHSVNLSQHYLDTLTQLQVKALLILPIAQSDRLWGLLVVHQCSNFRHWEPTEVNLLRRLANQLAVAVQQSELYQQVQQLNNTLEQQVQERTLQLQQALDFEAVLKRITDKVRDSLDEQQILQTVVQELASVLKVENCVAALKQPEGLTCYADTSSCEDSMLEVDVAPERYHSLFQAGSLQYCMLSEYTNQEPVEKLVCPIFIPSTPDGEGVQEILGDLCLSRFSHNSFNQQEIRLVQQVANQCAIALRQARLFRATQAQVEELERLNRLKDDFLSTVSHELRTPMSSIKMATQMLELILEQMGLFKDESNRLARYFQILQYESQREISLINDLLDLSRLEAGTEPLILSKIHLQDWIPHVLESFEERFQQQQQQLHLSFSPDLPAIVTDLSYLERILMELLQNAHKYTPAGERITVTASPIDEGVQVTVTNSGVEISALERDRIFDKFYRIPNNDPWKHGGTGLGLALVKRLVAGLGGSIELENIPQQTSFVVQLPLVVT